MLNLGLGEISSFSRKQKLNGKSLTEAESIVIDEALPQVLWTKYFVENEGYKKNGEYIISK